MVKLRAVPPAEPAAPPSTDSLPDWAKNNLTKIGEHEQHVYIVLCLHGPLTGQEVNRHLDNHFGHTFLHSLAEKGLVKKDRYRRRCTATGRNASSWMVVEGATVKPPPERIDSPSEKDTKGFWTELYFLGNLAKEQGHQLSPSFQRVLKWLSSTNLGRNQGKGRS